MVIKSDTPLTGRLMGQMAVCLLAFVLSAQASALAAEAKILNVYNWSDYIADDTIRNFEKETGIKVRYDNFDSNEVLHAKLVAGKSGYDVVVPGAAWGKIQAENGLLRMLDKSRLPNLKHLDPLMQSQLATLDPNNAHLVTWLYGYTTVGINVDKVKAALGSMPMPENAFDLVFDPKYMAKLKSCGVSFLDSPSEIFPTALHYLGKPVDTSSTADINAVGEMLQKVRPFVTLFSSSGYINDLTNGAICVTLGYSGDINIAAQRAREAKNGQKIVALIPKNGSILFLDTMAIPADAAHPDNAHLFINYVLRPEVQASLSNKVSYANPNLASMKFVKKEIAENKTIFLSDADKAKMRIAAPVSNDIRRLMSRLYTRFKTGI